MDRGVVVLLRASTERVASNAPDVSERYVIRVEYGHAEVTGGQWTRIDTQAVGVNLVVHVQDLRIPGPVETHVQNLGRGHGPSHGCAGHLHACRGNGVESVRAEASPGGRGGGVSGHRCGLEAIRIHVPPRDREFGVHFVIDLYEETVHRV